MARINWKVFEEHLRKRSLAALKAALAEYPEESYYAAAFHELYAEEMGMIAMPVLATNTLEELEDEADRWNPADWYWANIELADGKLEKMLDQITEDAGSQDKQHWHKTYERYVNTLIKVAKALAGPLRKMKQTTPEFGVFVFSEDDTVEILKRCTTPARFKKLFPELHEDELAKQLAASGTVAERIKRCCEDLYSSQDEILDIGEPAIPALIREVKAQTEDSWIAASLLGKLGIANRDVVEALRGVILERSGKVGLSHEAQALGLLGDHEFLIELAGKSEFVDEAEEGVLAIYSCLIEGARGAYPLDYRLLEQLIEVTGHRPKTPDGMPPTREITKDDVPEALRGLESQHEFIREHAVCCLGDRSLGKAAGDVILPALAKRLSDKSSEVRRLAIVSLSFWKKAAKPYVEQIRKLERDRVEKVRSTAEHYADEIAGC